MLILDEIWKDIPGYEGLYQASTKGRIRSLDREVSTYDINTHGLTKRIIPGKILSPGKTGDYRNYYLVALYKNGKKQNFRVHYLVMLTFVGPRPDGMDINHIDENGLNNELSNLEYVSRSYNINWGSRNKRASSKQTNRKDRSKIVIQYNLDGSYVRQYQSIHEVQRLNGYAYQNIQKCCHNKAPYAYGFIWKFK